MGLPGTSHRAKFSAAIGRAAKKSRNSTGFLLAHRMQPGLRAKGQKGSARAMDNTVLVGLSQQLAVSASMDTIANNLANMSTPGFKRDVSLFQQYLEPVKQSEGETGFNTLSLAWNAGTSRDLTAGHIEPTSAPYDLAINGSGYFVVQTANGPRYTRDGHFTLDTQGRVVTEDGDPLQGEGGNVTIAPEDGNVTIAKDGTLSGLKGQLGKIQVVQFADESQLVKEGANLYSTTQAPQPATSATVLQGAIESSNVEPVVEMSQMIEIMRAYQAMTSLMQSHEDLKRSAVDKLASTQT
jgi:flagellar basal-body rod protein FlgF